MSKRAPMLGDKQLYPLTSSQMSLVMSQIFSLEPLAGRREMNALGAYFMVEQDCDLEALERAWNTLLERHDALRTRLVIKGLGVYQYIDDYAYKSLDVVHIEDTPQAVDAYIETAYQHRFKTFSSDFAWAEIGQAGTAGILLMRFHHYCIDGFSLGIIFKALEKYYDSYAAGVAPAEEKTYSITKYFEMSQRYLTSAQYERDRKFWKKSFNTQRHYSFPAGRRSELTDSDYLTALVTGDDYDKLKSFCKANNCTVQSAAMTLAAILTYAKKGADNFSLTAISHNRTTPVLKQTVGCMMTSFLTFFDIDTSLTVNAFARQSHMRILNHMSHAKFPVDRANRYIFKESIKHGFNFFHQWAMFSTMELEAVKQSLKYRASGLPMRHYACQFYCAVLEVEQDACVTIDLIYQSRKYKPEQAQGVLDDFMRLLRIALADPEATVEEVRDKFLSA